MVGVGVAALTDWATYRLSTKMMGPGSSAGAVSRPPLIKTQYISQAPRLMLQIFLSVTSLFHAHVLPRSLSNSPETLLTTLALVYFPFRHAGAPKAIVVGDQQLVASQSMKDLSRSSGRLVTSGVEDEKETVIKVDDIADINYAVMDRLGPDVVEQEGWVHSPILGCDVNADFDRPFDSLILSLFFAGLAMCIRTTTLPLWLYLGPDYFLRVTRQKGFFAGVYVGWLALMTGLVQPQTHPCWAALILPVLPFLHSLPVSIITSPASCISHSGPSSNKMF